MRVFVTLQTITVEGIQHGAVMRLLMAITTVGHGRVLGLVTEGAIKCPVFGLAPGQHFEEFRVAGPTILGWDIIGILDIKGAMRLMATQTIFIGQEIGMRGMTFQTFFDLFVLGRMAKGTVFGSMFAGEVGKLLTLLRVAGFTGHTDRRHVVDGNI